MSDWLDHILISRIANDDDFYSNASTTVVSTSSGATRSFQPSQRADRHLSHQSAVSSNSETNGRHLPNIEGRDIGVERSWFARIFHIKPTSKIICFSEGRGKIRQEIVRLLRGWKVYGMRDVVFDRERNLVLGRLAGGNCKWAF